MPTELFLLIGSDLSNSPSPYMMNSAFRCLNIDANYEAVSTDESSFPDLMSVIREKEVKGFNVTMPFKSKVIQYLDQLDKVSKQIKAVNTVIRDGKEYIGHNTDVRGIVKGIMGKDISDAILIGAGGTARAFIAAMNEIGCKNVYIINRSVQRAKELANEIGSKFPTMNFSILELSKIERGDRPDAQLIFNATPMGSYKATFNEVLFNLISEGITVFDAVYLPIETPLLREAKKRGCNIIYGYEMLIEQGAAAFELWTGKVAPIEQMRKVVLDFLRSRS